MPEIALSEATASLKHYVDTLEDDILAVTVRGKARYVLAPVAVLERLGVSATVLAAAAATEPEAKPQGGPAPDVVIYTDGGCIGNPGPGGYGAAIFIDGEYEEASGGFRLTTNNRMEIMGAIAALESLKQRSRVVLYSDSQYLVNAMEQGWVTRWKAKGWMRTPGQPALNVDLWERMLKVVARHEVRFEWVRGHLGDPNNERAHELSVKAAKSRRTPARSRIREILGYRKRLTPWPV